MADPANTTAAGTKAGEKPAARKRFKVGMTARFMVLVVGLVGLAAIFLTPRRDEQLAVLADENCISEFIAEVERQLAVDSKNPRLLAGLAWAYEAQGYFRMAAYQLERYSALTPSETGVLLKLAEMYERAEDEPSRIGTLERLLALAPTLTNAVALSDAYNHNGRERDARGLLVRLADDLPAADSGVSAIDFFLAARLAFNAQDLPLARLYLDRINAGKLGATDQLVWFSLVKALLEPPLVLQTLEVEQRKGGLCRDVLLQYALLAQSYNQDQKRSVAIAEATRASKK